MKRLPLLIAVLLVFKLTAAFAQEPVHHDHAPSHDGRAVLALSPGERAVILKEMWMLLDGVQKMTGALGRQDMPAVAAAARAIGQKLAHEVPAPLGAKLPLEFRQLGSSVHRDFDQIAMDADTLGDVSYALNQLSSTLQKCVACHATYQIRTPFPDPGR